MDKDAEQSKNGIPRRNLSGDLLLLAKLSREKEIKIRDINKHLGAQGPLLTIFFLNLPFIIPISIPGISSFIGFAIIILTLHIILKRDNDFQGKLADKPLPRKFFPSLLKASAKVLHFFESFLRPRILCLTETSVIYRLHAGIVLLSAFILLLPLPIPFSNFLPGLSILFLIGGLMERDGLSLLIGHIMFILGATFVSLVSLLGIEILGKLKTWLAFLQ